MRSDGDLEAAALRIIQAWTVQGSNPRYHQDQIQRLDREWPTLARAIRELVEVW